MKQKILGISALLLMLVVSGSALFAKDIPVAEKDLPQAVRSYVNTHFPESAIALAVKDTEGVSHSYEIKLNNAVELDFNAKGEITSIDGREKLPDSVLPEKILTYVQAQYPQNYITDWAVKKTGHEVELDNGLELKFNRKGDFLRADN